MKKFITVALLILLTAGLCFATTFNTYINGTYGKPQTKRFMDGDKRSMYVLSQTVEFAKQNLNASNTLRILQIPADTYVSKCWIEVTTATAANGTVDLGDGTDVDFFGNGLPLDATGYVSPTLVGSATFDPTALDTGEFSSCDITVNGAALGDKVLVSMAADISDLSSDATVSAADTVTVVITNNSDTIYTGNTTWDPEPLGDGSLVEKTVTVTGAALGDYCSVGFTQDISDLALTAMVTATNTVTAALIYPGVNDTSGSTPATVDVISGTLYAMVTSKADTSDVASTTAHVHVVKSLGHQAGGKYYTSADTIDIVTTTDTASTNLTTGVIQVHAICYDMSKF